MFQKVENTSKKERAAFNENHGAADSELEPGLTNTITFLSIQTLLFIYVALKKFI